MSTRRFLILVPLVLSLLLLQSYFWVPTYDEQARGNPGRLEEYINASIGDASILNPILSADSASSEIDNLVFEGLIDRDENLRFRGRVAHSWEVTEEAFFFVNEAARLPGGPSSLRRTVMYVSFLVILRALQLNVFDQPVKYCSVNNLTGEDATP